MNDFYLKSNSILISQVANGWTVELPDIQHYDSNDVIMPGFKSAMVEIIQTAREDEDDKILRDIRNAQIKDDKKGKIFPVIETNKCLHLFKTFNEACEFLKVKIQEHGLV